MSMQDIGGQCLAEHLPRHRCLPGFRSIDERAVVLCPTMFVDSIENGAVVLQHYYNPKHEESIAAQEVLWVGAQRANDGLVQGLRDARIRDVRVVGDAYMPRRLSQAIAEGYRAGVGI
mgnify:CR=1 FL=1